MAFNRAGIEKAWESIAAKGGALKESAVEFAETAKNSRAGGMVSDSAAAIHGIGLHTLGGAAMGGTINAAAYANDGHTFTSADSGASAFLSGAGYGAAAGMGLGMMHAKKYAAYNAAKRASSGLKQGKMTKAMQERADVNTANVKRGLQEHQTLKDIHAVRDQIPAAQERADWADSQAANRMQAAQRRNQNPIPTLTDSPVPQRAPMDYSAPQKDNSPLKILPNDNGLQMPVADFNARKGFNPNDTIMSPNFGYQPKQYNGPLLKNSKHRRR